MDEFLSTAGGGATWLVAGEGEENEEGYYTFFFLLLPLPFLRMKEQHIKQID